MFAERRNLGRRRLRPVRGADDLSQGAGQGRRHARRALGAASPRNSPKPASCAKRRRRCSPNTRRSASRPRRTRPTSSRWPSEAEAYAAETRHKLAETLERRTKQAEQKIAQAEAQAVKEVRNLATDIAVAAATGLAGDAVKGAKGAALVDDSIAAVKSRLN